VTTVAEEKSKREQDLKDSPVMITTVRLEVIQKVELADEMKSQTDDGLTDPYPVIALFYGKQRSLLRGLTLSDVINFNLPTSTNWNAGTDFVFPTKTQFGYEFYDTAGDPATIDDATKYYLAKRKSDNVLCTLETIVEAFTAPLSVKNYNQIVSISDGDKKNFDFDLAMIPVPGTIKIYHGETQIGQDDGSGNLTGTNITGSTVVYASPFTVDLNYSSAPAKDLMIKFVYDSYANESDFTDDYEQVDFTLSTKGYGSGLTLKLLNIVADVLDKRPTLLHSMYLRRKTDHQVVGTVLITCEGLAVDSSWNHLTGDPEDTTLLDHAEFKTLLGYLSPDNTDDLAKSADPYNASNGRKDGSSYPDIEMNPMYPATDGTYIDKPAFKGNHVHEENSVAVWAINSDIKWQYGTKPTGLDVTTQNNPDTLKAAIDAINNFSSANPTTIPADTGSVGAAGDSYSMVGNFVHKFVWSGGPPCTSDGGSEYPCYYNDVQHLKEDHLLHLQTQLAAIATLGDTTNTIDAGRQSGDTQFVTDSATFKTALDTFLSYHNAFDPITSRPTYATSQMTTLKAAANATNGYRKQAGDRITDLESVIGTPETSGYSKKIYDSCNAAVRKDIGYARDVIDRLNSIQDVYDLIDQQQSEYAMYP
jgi:hypothetical protein